MAGLFAACGNSAIPISDVQGHLVDVQCANEVECLDEPDATTCQSIAGSATTREFATLEADVADGVVKYDADALQSCLDELGSSPCVFQGEHQTQADCNKVFTGTVATAGACFISEECISDDCVATDDTCDTSTTCCPGTCGSAAAAPGAIGAACSDTMPCVDSAFCNVGSGSSDAGTCAALLTTEGAACVQGQCANPRYCDTSKATAACTTPPAEGSACTTDDDIQCADSRDYCDATSLKCTPLAKVGAACVNAPCEQLAFCLNGLCVADPLPGAACTATGSDETAAPCLGDLQCVNSICALPANTAGSDCH